MPPFQIKSKSLIPRKSKIYEIPQEAIDSGEFSFGALNAAATIEEQLEPGRGYVNGIGSSGDTLCLHLDKKTFKASQPYFDKLVSLAVDYTGITLQNH
jgi:hypothetical protein